MPKTSQSVDDSNGQRTPKSAKNKRVTTSKAEGDSAPTEPSKVPVDDSTSTTKVSNSNKHNNKLSNKPTDLAEIVKAWPELPEAIRSAIVAIVRASIDKQER